MQSCQIFYWYGYALTFITKATANFDVFMQRTFKAAKKFIKFV